ncbi:hypothetical protein GCM10009760_34100 [Kitasatospora kazusensis]|uniref:Immunity protein 63 domain-containing protein n=1 Tax=Kitasatospora kazusensis TaxID=407974 RepID=A0ABN2ZPR5_9ACTN
MYEDERTRMRRYLETEISRLSALVRLTGGEVPGFTDSDGARPFIRLDEDGRLRQLARERGELVLDRVTRDPRELLYWVFEGATFEAAGAWAVEHPREGEEQRVTIWTRQASLLHVLDPEWARRRRAELVGSLADPADHRLVPALPPPPLLFDPPSPPDR